MLCGISSRFQLLSPTGRQVPHALLTRSPLNLVSFGRSRIPLSPVRLACVRHAASVRPEPGSNSQKIVSKQPFGCSNHLSNNLSSKYTQEFSLAVIRSKTLKQSICCQGVCSSLRYSIYKVQTASRFFAESLISIPQTSSIVKNFFPFSTIFFLLFFAPFAPPSGRRSSIISNDLSIVKGFFQKSDKKYWGLRTGPNT